MSTPEQNTTAAENAGHADGLAIFEDEHEVASPPVGVVGLQLLAVVLTYAVILGLAVLVVVVIVLFVSLLWPVLQDMSLP
ncbi:hypothetical protein [Cryobacterium arcticum]|uniref:Uncharacterized protein n=1 Tax=Cryobacterium arcticum TaxID=670052 RepID=A0A1B1BLF9_9MICO|nr:hypothetical protein [Cryobacterium arcticum]ANP73462.1 hypothetical protein PA27867_2514 [Cryobacterium arcticum]